MTFKDIKIERFDINQDSKPIKLNWTCSEVVSGSEEDKQYWREHFSKEKQEATDIANKYKVHHHKQFDEKDFPNQCFSSIRVLEFLNGKPWNNMAANYLMALRPSAVRVTTGEVTCDSYLWRVTVYVTEEGNIKYIEQEIKAGAIGIVNGTHISAYATGREMRNQPTGGIINVGAIRKLEKMLNEDLK